MIPTMGVIVVAIAIYFVEVPKFKKEGRTKEIIVFTVILFSATLLFSLEFYGVPMPNPLAGLKNIISPVGNSINRFFEVRQ